MIDLYELRRRMDDLRYRLTAMPRRTLVLGVIAAILVPVLAIVIVLVIMRGPESSSQTDSKVRERQRLALSSDDAKADTAKLAAMPEAEFTAELEKRRQVWDVIERAGNQRSEEGEKAWGSLLRASQIEAERHRRKPK
ncbi:MAG: hypothetical protein IT435_05090 [Phycisphaerales bacterium]|nr:hypothetical protein [Phycisphaerales bacterium]